MAGEVVVGEMVATLTVDNQMSGEINAATASLNTLSSTSVNASAGVDRL
jgi:hypothetical protein